MEVSDLIMTLDAGSDRLSYAYFLNLDPGHIDFSICPSCVGIAIPEKHVEEGCCSVCQMPGDVVEIGYMEVA